MTKKQAKLTPAIDLLLPSINVIYKNLIPYFLFLVLPYLLSITPGANPVTSEPTTVGELVDVISSNISPYAVLGAFLSLALYPMLTYTQYLSASGKEVSVGDVLGGAAKNYFRLIGLLLCMGIVIIIGLILFVIPGLIFLRRYSLAPYFMIHKQIGIIESMKLAASKSKPVSWSIYSVFAVMLLFSLFSGIGIVGLVIGTILTLLYNPALALRFHEIKAL